MRKNVILNVNFNKNMRMKTQYITNYLSTNIYKFLELFKHECNLHD